MLDLLFLLPHFHVLLGVDMQLLRFLCVYDVFQAPPKALSGESILNTLSQPFPSASMPSAEKIPAALPVTNCPLCELMITNVKGVL